MKRILLSLVVILGVSAVVAGATRAYFSDTETSTGNTFAAGTLDLNVDGVNTNVVKFTVANMRPGNQPTSSWTLANVGSINGYLDLENISVTNTENGRLDPEVDAGDLTDDAGELQDIVNLRLYIDRDKAGGYSAGDVMIYNGKVGNVAGNYDQNELIAAGTDARLVAVLDWWEGTTDNLAQGDGMTLNMTFELGQTTGQ